MTTPVNPFSAWYASASAFTLSSEPAPGGAQAVLWTPVAGANVSNCYASAPKFGTDSPSRIIGIYVKNAGLADIIFGMAGRTSTNAFYENGLRATFASGVAVASGTALIAVEDAGDGWLRCSAKAASTAAEAMAVVGTPVTGTYNGTDSLLLALPQVSDTGALPALQTVGNKTLLWVGGALLAWAVLGK